MQENGQLDTHDIEQKLEEISDRITLLQQKADWLQARQDIVTETVISLGPKGIQGLKWFAKACYLFFLPFWVLKRIASLIYRSLRDFPGVLRLAKERFWLNYYQICFTWVLLRVDHPNIIKRALAFPKQYLIIQPFIKR